MHDRNGSPLKVGDIVTMKLRILETYAGEEYCNVRAESVDGRKPDGAKETFVGNTAVLVLVESAE